MNMRGRTCLFETTRELGVRLRLRVFCRDASARPPGRWLCLRLGVHRARLWPFLFRLVPYVGIAPTYGVVVNHAL
jgi:hypothetical protein